jgi:hypothetical protein
MGLTMLDMALQHASPEVAPMLAANGLAVAHYTSIFAALLSGFILAISAVLSILILALRWKTTDSDGAKEASARIELLGGISLLATTAVAAIGWGFWLHTKVMYFEALASASEETRATMMASAMQSGNRVMMVTLILMGLIGICGLATVVSKRHRLVSSAWLSLGVSAALSCLITCGLAATLISQGDYKAKTYSIEDGKLPGMPKAPDY